MDTTRLKESLLASNSEDFNSLDSITVLLQRFSDSINQNNDLIIRVLKNINMLLMENNTLLKQIKEQVYSPSKEFKEICVIKTNLDFLKAQLSLLDLKLSKLDQRLSAPKRINDLINQLRLHEPKEIEKEINAHILALLDESLKLRILKEKELKDSEYRLNNLESMILRVEDLIKKLMGYGDQ